MFVEPNQTKNSMATKIFVNLPVKDLNRSIAFFTKLGFTFNPQFTDEKATSMIVSDDIYIMLLVEDFFRTFTRKEIADATKTTEAIICLSAESREKVDEMVRLAIEAGGTAPNDKQDHGWMYGHGFQDLDGHLWEVAYMDESAISQTQDVHQQAMSNQ
jgi:predicted lactoylglutathione lyase